MVGPLSLRRLPSAQLPLCGRADSFRVGSGPIVHGSGGKTGSPRRAAETGMRRQGPRASDAGFPDG